MNVGPRWNEGDENTVLFFDKKIMYDECGGAERREGCGGAEKRGE